MKPVTDFRMLVAEQPWCDPVNGAGQANPDTAQKFATGDSSVHAERTIVS